MKKDKYQNVYIELSDGRTGFFTGPAIVKKKDVGKVSVVNVKFTDPKSLPDGCTWDTLTDEKINNVKI